VIPVKLQLRGFLSYKEPIELSFDDFDLACIAGDNGAGKSSLLDAITWALFGKARRNDDSVINNTCREAEVIFQFLYENALYRIQRLKTRDRPLVLEFQIRSEEDHWKVLSEHGVAETQKIINETLHMDYETFINASFFLQGRADEFTQKNSSQRKEILAGILGMDVWEHYKGFTSEVRRHREGTLRAVEGSLHEIEESLAKEGKHRKELEQAKEELKRLETMRKEQQSVYDQASQLVNMVKEQQKSLGEMKERYTALLASLQQHDQQLKERIQEEEHLMQIVDKSEQIESNYRVREKLVEKLHDLNELANRFFQLQQKQNALEKSIAVEESRLKQELLTLEQEKGRIQEMVEQRGELEKKKVQLFHELRELQECIKEGEALKNQLQEKFLHLHGLQNENNALLEQMQKANERLQRLQEEKGSVCPLCGQALSESHRQQVIAQLDAEESQAKELYKKNEHLISKLQKEIDKVEDKVSDVNEQAEQFRVKEHELVALESELNHIQTALANWEQSGVKDLQRLEEKLANQDFAHDVRAQEAKLRQEMDELGYDVELHDSVREEEQNTREVEKQHQEMLIATSRLEPLQREVSTLRSAYENDQRELNELVEKMQALEKQIAELENHMPDVATIEDNLKELVDQENQQRTAVGGAMRLVEELEAQKERRQTLLTQIKSLSKEQANFLMLEKDFGREGVQALLIEEALPQMQMQANEILSKLSSGNMSIRFQTEREYKDKKRDDKMQVLDILISDAEGVQRPYDLYSGGEAFRINFAIRLALSKVLAQRAGARLQMLIIDEGFGSQDAEGRQRLIEAINMIRPDFKKILVITHLEELKDAFPARIEVSKTKRGSQIEVIRQ